MASLPTSPAAAQLELNTRLRELQIARGMSAREVSAALEFSPNFWSALVNNRNVISKEKLAQLHSIFDLSAAELAELEGLRRVARGPRWWDEYNSFVHEEVLEFIGLEYGACRIQNFENSLISGLLQTEEYASALFRTSPNVSAATLRRRWALRRRRQERLWSDNPVQISAMMGEAAVRQHYGEPRILRSQLEYLLGLADRSSGNIELRILPFSANPLGLTGASTLYLLGFESPHLGDLAWRESIRPSGLESDPDEIEQFRVSFEDAWNESALSASETLSFIADRVGELT